MKAVFCLLELFVYIQLVTCTLLSCIAQFSYWFPVFTLFIEDLWKHAASKFFHEIDILSEKLWLKRHRKIDRISWYYWICLEWSIKGNEHTYVVLIYLFYLFYLLFSHNKDYTSITLYKDVARGPQKTTRLVRGGPDSELFWKSTED